MTDGVETKLERLQLRVTATADSVPKVRRALAEFADRHGVGNVSDVALAVTEATTNAILHAYRAGATGSVRIVACAERSRLVVVVRVYGCGMRPNPQSPGLGLGLSLIGRFTSDVDIERPHDGGTRLRMHFAY
jgi:serine/threonine-protein kinase RsbW/stage II sporulation protein AB (anti-sigma F factor)